MNYCKRCQARLTTNRGYFEELGLCFTCEESLPDMIEFRKEFIEFDKRSIERKKQIAQLEVEIQELNKEINKDIRRILK